MDVLTAEQRRFNMSRVRSSDTRPEMIVRRSLHAAGFRYRLHVKALPGQPDLVLPARNAVVFVHGCFWHGHHCRSTKLPATRPEFWADKIDGNRARDQRSAESLLKAGWRVFTIWECALRGPRRRHHQEMLEAVSTWLRSDVREGVFSGSASVRGDPARVVDADSEWVSRSGDTA